MIYMLSVSLALCISLVGKSKAETPDFLFAYITKEIQHQLPTQLGCDE